MIPDLFNTGDIDAILMFDIEYVYINCFPFLP